MNGQAIKNELVRCGWRQDEEDPIWWWPPAPYVGYAYTKEKAWKQCQKDQKKKKAGA